jgi:hypothetical protein
MSSEFTPLDVQVWRDSNFSGTSYILPVPQEGVGKYCAIGRTTCRAGELPVFGDDAISSIKVPYGTKITAQNTADSTVVNLGAGNHGSDVLRANLIHDNISHMSVQRADDFKKTLATCCVKGPMGDECKFKEGVLTPSNGRCEDVIRDYCKDIASKGKTDDDICGCYNIPPEVQSKFDELFGGVSEPPTCWYKPCVNAIYQPSNWKTHQCRDLKICNQLSGKIDIKDMAKLSNAEIGKMSCSIGDSSSLTPSAPTPPPPPPSTDSNNTALIVGIVFVVLMIVVVLMAVMMRRSRGGSGGVLFENEIVDMV